MYDVSGAEDFNNMSSKIISAKADLAVKPGKTLTGWV